MMKLVFGTSNRWKLAEFAEIARVSGLDIEIVTPKDLGFDGEIEETGQTFQDNADIKALTLARALGERVFAEDSGLCVDALGGWPGVSSKRVAETDTGRIALLLDRMRDLPESERRARFVCHAALADPDGVKFRSSGEVEGWIAFEPRGASGFGYDPVFFYPPAGKTFSEMTLEEKSLVSHRWQAIQAFCEWLM